jgi:hypothetical protein
MAKYRKRPVVIEAIHYIDHETSHQEVREFVTVNIDERGIERAIVLSTRNVLPELS